MNSPAGPDLDYADPVPSPDFLQRTRTQGRAIRRRRRAGGAAAAVAAAALAGVLAVHLTSGTPLDRRAVAGPAATPSPSVDASAEMDLAALPFSRGRDPEIQYTRTSGTTPVAWATDDAGQQPLTWFDTRSRLCTGERAGPGADTVPRSCDELVNAPAEGLWLNEVAARSERGDLDSPEPVNARIFGLVRGPVTRVVVDLPLSGAVDAPLRQAPDGLGTVYLLTTRDFTIDGKVAGAALTAESAEDNFPLAITVYRGDTPLFHCADVACWVFPGDRPRNPSG